LQHVFTSASLAVVAIWPVYVADPFVAVHAAALHVASTTVGVATGHSVKTVALVPLLFSK
jgi:hypothetical protein